MSFELANQPATLWTLQLRMRLIFFLILQKLYHRCVGREKAEITKLLNKVWEPCPVLIEMPFFIHPTFSYSISNCCTYMIYSFHFFLLFQESVLPSLTQSLLQSLIFRNELIDFIFIAAGSFSQSMIEIQVKSSKAKEEDLIGLCIQTTEMWIQTHGMTGPRGWIFSQLTLLSQSICLFPAIDRLSPCDSQHVSRRFQAHDFTMLKPVKNF